MSKNFNVIKLNIENSNLCEYSIESLINQRLAFHEILLT